MAARLKVFGWSDGFHSWTVATTSRAKALAAWEVEQDLFKTGLAHEIDTGPERDQALASPGTVIKSGLAIDAGTVAGAKPKPAAKSARDAARRRKAEARVAELKSELDALDARSATELEALQTRLTALEQEIEAVRTRDETARASLKARLLKARKAV